MADERSVEPDTILTSNVGDDSEHHINGNIKEDEEDDFAGILEETNSSPRDVANLPAVNYKVSMEEYEKVDLFQTSPAGPTDQTISTHQLEISSPSEQENNKQINQNTHQQPYETASHTSPDKTTTNSAIFPPPGSQQPVDNSSEVSKNSDDSPGHVINPSVPEENIRQLISDDHQRQSPVEPSEQLLKAQAEWDAVGTIQPAGSGGDTQQGKYGPTSGQTPTISFNEALAHFQRCDMTQYMSKIKPTVQRSGWSAIKHYIVGPPKMKPSLQEERNLVFAIAQCPFDDNEDIHKRVLQTIYKQLTGSTIDCPRFGTHWEQIGFQGNDPSTDLRACGFLGLMTLLHFLMDPQRLMLAKEIYKLSLHETQNFPFCVMSINMTRIALQTLREEQLSRECNRRKQVLGVVNDFYAGIYLNLYQVWKQQHKTIKDSGFVIKDVETNAKKNPREVMRCLEEYLQDKSSGTGNNSVGAKSSMATKDAAAMDFAGVHELDEEEEGVGV